MLAVVACRGFALQALKTTYHLTPQYMEIDIGEAHTLSQWLGLVPSLS